MIRSRAPLAAVALAFTAATLGAAVTPGSALAADRPPNAEERAAIEAALKADGFARWGEIELDGGKWEVDDAVHADGKEYDVDLSLAYKIIKKDLD